MAPEDADRYECLVAQRVLSVQVTQAEQNQRHNLFHTKGVVKERSVQDRKSTRLNSSHD